MRINKSTWKAILNTYQNQNTKHKMIFICWASMIFDGLWMNHRKKVKNLGEKFLKEKSGDFIGFWVGDQVLFDSANMNFHFEIRVAFLKWCAGIEK